MIAMQWRKLYDIRFITGMGFNFLTIWVSISLLSSCGSSHDEDFLTRSANDPSGIWELRSLKEGPGGLSLNIRVSKQTFRADDSLGKDPRPDILYNRMVYIDRGREISSITGGLAIVKNECAHTRNNSSKCWDGALVLFAIQNATGTRWYSDYHLVLRVESSSLILASDPTTKESTAVMTKIQ